MTLKIGTRKSPLALAQAHEVRNRLLAAWPELEVELVHIITSGDQFLDRPLSDIGGKGLFTKEIEEGLLSGDIDLAVHSMKDMPTLLPGGLIISAMLEREDARDMLVGQGLASLADLPQGAVLGTSSLRRAAQVKMVRPDVQIVPLRGNVQTRLDKLQRGEMQATLLAKAGLNRLQLTDVPGAVLAIEEFLPAVAQGAIGIECREGDAKIRELLAPLSHQKTEIAVECERAFLRVLDGSCRTPIAGYATIISSPLVGEGQGGGALSINSSPNILSQPPLPTLPHKGGGQELCFRGLIAEPDGSMHRTVERRGKIADAKAIGIQAGMDLLEKN